jgi:Tfp pilus assembly protein PilV
MIKKNKKGQSLIEVVLAIGIIVLVVTGVISLIVNAVSIKTAALQRQKASDLAGIVAENLLQQKNTNNFWNLNKITNSTLVGFEGFTYNVGFSQVTDGAGSFCSKGVNCANATITINWGAGKILTVERFFSK